MPYQPVGGPNARSSSPETTETIEAQPTLEVAPLQPPVFKIGGFEFPTTVQLPCSGMAAGTTAAASAWTSTHSARTNRMPFPSHTLDTEFALSAVDAYPSPDTGSASSSSSSSMDLSGNSPYLDDAVPATWHDTQLSALLQQNRTNTPPPSPPIVPVTTSQETQLQISMAENLAATYKLATILAFDSEGRFLAAFRGMPGINQPGQPQQPVEQIPPPPIMQLHHLVEQQQQAPMMLEQDTLGLKGDPYLGWNGASMNASAHAYNVPSLFAMTPMVDASSALDAITGDGVSWYH